MPLQRCEQSSRLLLAPPMSGPSGACRTRQREGWILERDSQRGLKRSTMDSEDLFERHSRRARSLSR